LNGIVHCRYARSFTFCAKGKIGFGQMLDVHSVNDQQAEGTDMIANIDIAVDASLETYKFV
jgi:hypothetical protein